MGDFLSAAYQVLKAENRPLTASEITAISLRKGLLETEGKTPSQTMKSKLSTNILSDKGRSLFMRTEKARFALREWVDRYPEHIADRYQKALFDEDIVVVPASFLLRLLPRTGLLRDAIDTSAIRSQTKPMRRRIAEDDPSVIQLVSVFMLTYRSKYLTYKRTKRLPEARLHGYRSIAFGGHLNPDDIPLFDIFSPKQATPFLLRELAEEVKLEPHAIESMDYRGLLYDDSRQVSRQHLGIVYRVRLRTSKFEIGERGFLIDPKFETLRQIRNGIDEYENWSAILIRDEERRLKKVSTKW